MKKILAATLLATLLGGIAPAEAAQVATGATCKKLGAVAMVKAAPDRNVSKSYTCTKVKGKLVYGPAKNLYKFKSLLTVSQVWKGNSVALSITDSNGNDCGANSRTVGSECYGFYLGWSANFNDANRVVDYSKVDVTTISGLQVGDNGAFQLKYQDPTNQMGPITIVKEFPFSYDY